MLKTEKFKSFLELTNQKKQLEASLDTVKRQIADLEEELLDNLVEAEVDSLKVNGKTIYPHKQMWAKVLTTKEDVIQALKKAGIDHIYVKEGFNHQSLSAYVRECINEWGELPAEFDGILGFSEKYSLRARA